MSFQSLYGPEPPAPEPMPNCPVCGDKCETVYKNCDGEVIACDGCINSQDAWEWQAEEKEAEEADRGDRLYHEWRDRQCS